MKLPVLATVRAAYAFVWTERRLFLLPATAGTAVLAAAGWLTARAGRLADGTSGAGLWPDVAALAAALVYLAVLVAYSVVWHRAYLLDGERTAPGDAFRWGRRHNRFLLGYLKIFLVMILPATALLLVTANAAEWMAARLDPSAAGAAFSAQTVVRTAATVAVWLVLGWTWARLSMVFPAAAADRPMGVRQSWRFTGGTGVRLFWTVVLAAVPMGVAVGLMDRLAQEAVAASTAAGTMAAALAVAAVGHFFGFAAIAVVVTVLSIAYKRLSAAQPPEAAP